MRIVKKIRQIICRHDFMHVWESDYKRHVLGDKSHQFINLQSKRSIKYCPKCGRVEEYINVPTEEVAWADYFLMSHFKEAEK